jgi:chromosome segregation ATPase
MYPTFTFPRGIESPDYNFFGEGILWPENISLFSDILPLTFSENSPAVRINEFFNETFPENEHFPLEEPSLKRHRDAAPQEERKVKKLRSREGACGEHLDENDKQIAQHAEEIDSLRERLNQSNSLVSGHESASEANKDSNQNLRDELMRALTENQTISRSYYKLLQSHNELQNEQQQSNMNLIEASRLLLENQSLRIKINETLDENHSLKEEVNAFESRVQVLKKQIEESAKVQVDVKMALHEIICRLGLPPELGAVSLSI